MTYPSHIARTALRKALREHPLAETILAGRKASELTVDDLHKGLRTLGVDPAAVIRAAGATRVDLCNRDNPPQAETETAETAAEHEELMGAFENDDHPAVDDVEAEVQTIRGLIVTGGFSALDDRLRQLVTEARKPAVEVRVEVPVDLGQGPRPVHCAKPTGKMATWRSLFDVRGPLGKRETMLWDGTHPDTPEVNDRYVWPEKQTKSALCQIARGRNVMLFGPAGTGKTEFAQQLAARTGRPFALISCDNGTDSATLVGMTVPDVSGGTTFQDGQLTRAIRTPGCVVCIDEPSVARPGALFVMQNMLANRQLFLGENGYRVKVAPGVVFLSTDNTNGTGGGARRGYTDTNKLNTAYLDRFGIRVKVDYLPQDQEIAVLMSYTGCTVELAELLVKAAAVTRAAADNATLSHGIGLRRLFAWAEQLTDGIDAETAFEDAVLNAAPEQDVETLREQCLLAYDASNVRHALAGATLQPAAVDPADGNPTFAGRNAARDFTTV